MEQISKERYEAMLNLLVQQRTQAMNEIVELVGLLADKDKEIKDLKDKLLKEED